MPALLLPTHPRGTCGGRRADRRPSSRPARSASTSPGYLRAELGVGEVARQMRRRARRRRRAGDPGQAALAPEQPPGHEFAGSGHGRERRSRSTSSASTPTTIAASSPKAAATSSSRTATRSACGGGSSATSRSASTTRSTSSTRSGSARGSSPRRSRRRTTVPVVPIRVPVDVPAAAAAAPRVSWMAAGRLHLPLLVRLQQRLPARKNPVGAVEAYKRAFPPGDGASLVLKSINGETRPAEPRRVLLALARRARTSSSSTSTSPPARRHRITASCDCYVSLHRSEGFGLTIAEAMYLGKPGDRDRLLRQRRLPRRAHRLPRPLRPGAGRRRRGPLSARRRRGPIPTSSTPRSSCATSSSTATRRARRGVLAAELMRADYSPLAAGQLLRSRLDRIRARRGGGRLARPRPESARG